MILVFFFFLSLAYSQISKCMIMKNYWFFKIIIKHKTASSFILTWMKSKISGKKSKEPLISTCEGALSGVDEKRTKQWQSQRQNFSKQDSTRENPSGSAEPPASSSNGSALPLRFSFLGDTDHPVCAPLLLLPPGSGKKEALHRSPLPNEWRLARWTSLSPCCPDGTPTGEWKNRHPAGLWTGADILRQ